MMTSQILNFLHTLKTQNLYIYCEQKVISLLSKKNHSLYIDNYRMAKNIFLVEVTFNAHVFVRVDYWFSHCFCPSVI